MRLEKRCHQLLETHCSLSALSNTATTNVALLIPKIIKFTNHCSAMPCKWSRVVVPKWEPGSPAMATPIYPLDTYHNQDFIRYIMICHFMPFKDLNRIDIIPSVPEWLQLARTFQLLNLNPWSQSIGSTSKPHEGQKRKTTIWQVPRKAEYICDQPSLVVCFTPSSADNEPLQNISLVRLAAFNESSVASQKTQKNLWLTKSENSTWRLHQCSKYLNILQCQNRYYPPFHKWWGFKTWAICSYTTCS